MTDIKDRRFKVCIKNQPGSNLGSSFLMGGSIVFFTSVWRESVGLVSIFLQEGSLTTVNQSE